MNINGVQIPTYMINMITDHMTTLVKGGMEATDALEYAVRLADADMQSIGRQMLAGNHMNDASVIRNAIAAEVYTDIKRAA